MRWPRQPSSKATRRRASLICGMLQNYKQHFRSTRRSQRRLKPTLSVKYRGIIKLSRPSYIRIGHALNNSYPKPNAKRSNVQASALRTGSVFDVRRSAGIGGKVVAACQVSHRLDAELGIVNGETKHFLDGGYECKTTYRTAKNINLGIFCPFSAGRSSSSDRN